jgi:hypothetical protein
LGISCEKPRFYDKKITFVPGSAPAIQIFTAIYCHNTITVSVCIVTVNVCIVTVHVCIVTVTVGIVTVKVYIMTVKVCIVTVNVQYLPFTVII